MTDIIDAIYTAQQRLNRVEPIKRYYTLIVSRETLTLYDAIRPWASIQEHITNTKFSSNGKVRGGVKYILVEDIYDNSTD